MATKLVPVKEASKVLGIGEQTLRNAVKEGKQGGQTVAHKCWVEVDERLMPNLKDDESKCN